MLTRFDPQGAHPKARALFEILLRGDHLPPMTDDEVDAILTSLFDDEPPPPDAVGRLLVALYTGGAGFSKPHPKGPQPEAHGVIIEEFGEYTWFSAFNAAMRADEPVRFLRISDKDDIYAYVLRGPRMAELDVRCPYDVDHGAAEMPDQDDVGLYYREVAEEDREAELAAINARLAVHGFEVADRLGDDFEHAHSGGPLDDTYGLTDLASYVDLELIACGSARRVLYVGTWEGGNRLVFLITSPALAAELAAEGYTITSAGDVDGGAEIEFPDGGPDTDRPFLHRRRRFPRVTPEGVSEVALGKVVTVRGLYVHDGFGDLYQRTARLTLGDGPSHLLAPGHVYEVDGYVRELGGTRTVEAFKAIDVGVLEPRPVGRVRIAAYATPSLELARVGKHATLAYTHRRFTIAAVLEGIGHPATVGTELGREVMRRLFDPFADPEPCVLADRAVWDGIEPAQVPDEPSAIVTFVAAKLAQVYDRLPEGNRVFFSMGIIACIDDTSATVLRAGDACVYRVRGDNVTVVVEDQSIARDVGQPMLGYPHRGGTTSFGHAPTPLDAPCTIALAPNDRLVLLDGRVLYQASDQAISDAIAGRPTLEEVVDRLEQSEPDPLARTWAVMLVDRPLE